MPTPIPYRNPPRTRRGPGSTLPDPDRPTEIYSEAEMAEIDAHILRRIADTVARLNRKGLLERMAALSGLPAAEIAEARARGAFDPPPDPEPDLAAALEAGVCGADNGGVAAAEML